MAQDLVPQQGSRTVSASTEPPPLPSWLARLLALPVHERLEAITEDQVWALQAWIDQARTRMVPADRSAVAEMIYGLMNAGNHALPNEDGLVLWFATLGQFPEWALRRATMDVLQEVRFRPTIADVVLRATRAVGEVRVDITKAEHLARFARPEPPDRKSVV